MRWAGQQPCEWARAVNQMRNVFWTGWESLDERQQRHWGSPKEALLESGRIGEQRKAPIVLYTKSCAYRFVQPIQTELRGEVARGWDRVEGTAVGERLGNDGASNERASNERASNARASNAWETNARVSNALQMNLPKLKNTSTNRILLS